MCNLQLTPPSEATRRVMKSNRSTGTNPELELLKLVRSASLKGYRKNYPNLPGKPDIYFLKDRVAVYMHGCFWHRCPHCKPSTPKSNAQFWSDKFTANVRRDRRVKRELSRMGVSYITIWECQVKKKAHQSLGRILRTLGRQKNNFSR